MESENKKKQTQRMDWCLPEVGVDKMSEGGQKEIGESVSPLAVGMKVSLQSYLLGLRTFQIFIQ